MLSPELQRKIQRLFIRGRYLANDIFAGEYVSAFRGRGMEFEEVREYFPGDDIRSIDWNVTARTGKPFVKVFREEREQTMMLVMDASASNRFGSKNRPKGETAAELAAVLAFAAIRSNDKVGLIVFTDRVELFIPPKKGRSHVWHVISAILSFEAKGSGTGLSQALEFLTRVLRRKSITFIISDFLAGDYDLPLKLASFRHEITGLMVRDPLERAFPEGLLISMTDLETGKKISIDMGSVSRRKSFEEMRRKELEDLQRRFRSLDIDFLSLEAEGDFIPPLLEFFRMREKRV